MSGTKLIETNRLVLRKVTMNDAHDLFINWASDIKTNEYLTFKCHDTEETTKKVISYWLKKYEENGFEWCIEIKDTKEVIASKKMLDACGVKYTCLKDKIDV